MTHYFSRRTFIAAGLAAGAATAAFPVAAKRTAGVTELDLAVAPARARLVGGAYPDTAVWAYNGAVPGPEIRAKQGDRLRVHVHNRLGEPTSVHFHGVRMPNAMDGVPYVTQDPIAPGAKFTYDFSLPDAGTFWYHPHVNSSHQLGRGLAGALVVEEAAPVPVDQELTWVLDDWRLDRSAAITPDFGDSHDLSHGGRVGNTVTVNGKIQEQFKVRSGARLRLRLVNTANARHFALRFQGHEPKIVALDGQPVEPHAPRDGLVVLAPAQRADLILDMTGAPGSRFSVTDDYYRGRGYRLLDIVYGEASPLRDRPPATPIALPANPLPEPDIANAAREEILLEGGAMGGMMGARMGGKGPGMGMRALAGRGVFWAINGVAMPESMREIPPLLTLERGRSYVLTMRNETVWDHPMHLHGHSFRVLGRDGRPTPHRAWRDTVLLRPRERVEVAFVADNPGDWMFHCHILEHQMAGMMGTIRVA